MIRHILLAGAAATLAACNPLASLVNNQAAQIGGSQRPEGSLTFAIAITASGPNGCEFTFDGAPITDEALLNRLTDELRAAYDQAGGDVAKIDLPVVNLDAPADMRFACVNRVLSIVYLSGVMIVRLGRGDGGPRRLAYAPMQSEPYSGPWQTNAIVALGAGSRVNLNGRPSERTALRSVAPDRDQTEQDMTTPDEVMRSIVTGGAYHVVVTVVMETTVSEVYDTLAALEGARPVLLLPGERVPDLVAPPQPVGQPPITRR